MSTYEIIQAAIAFGIPVIVGLAFSGFMSRAGKRIARSEGIKPRESLVYTLRLPVFLLTFFLGMYLSSQVVRAFEVRGVARFPWERLDNWLLALTTLTIIYAAYKASLHASRAAVHRAGGDSGSSLLAGKLVTTVFFAIALTTFITQLGVNVGPVLASLGVAGLAVALGLQDTLGNYFAGMVIAFDKPFRPGDYVRLQSGEEGFVEKIGWRSTHIKPFGETTVIVPNSKLTTEVVVNNFYPDLAVRVYVNCGVSYEADLQHVENVCVPVGREVQAKLEGADREWEPRLRYQEFGDSNITFMVILRSKTFGDSFLLRHEYMKALHAEFKAQGITINYPVRQIVRMNEGEEPPQRSLPLDKDVI